MTKEHHAEKMICCAICGGELNTGLRCLRCGMQTTLTTSTSAKESPRASHLQQPQGGVVSELRAVLCEHWLTSIGCDHDAGTNTPTCSCSLWKAPTFKTVGAAVDAWIDHVLAALPSPVADSLGAQAGNDEIWKDASRCAFIVYESYIRQGETATPDQRAKAIDDALQHAVGILSAAAPVSPVAQSELSGEERKTLDDIKRHAGRDNVIGFPIADIDFLIATIDRLTASQSPEIESGQRGPQSK